VMKTRMRQDKQHTWERREGFGLENQSERWLGRLRNIWEHDTKMDGGEIVSEGMNWIPLAQGRQRGKEVLLTVFWCNLISTNVAGNYQDNTEHLTGIFWPFICSAWDHQRRWDTLLKYVFEMGCEWLNLQLKVPIKLWFIIQLKKWKMSYEDILQLSNFVCL
jgi:hypothetical protein